MRTLLFLLLPMLAFAQVKVDTVELYDSVRLRVLVHGDTVMMSVRQMENMVGHFRQLDTERDLQDRQIQNMWKAQAESDKVIDKYKQLDTMSVNRNDMLRREYDTLVGIAKNQNELLSEINRKTRGKVWMGIGCGAVGGALIGTIIGVIISR